MKTYENPSNEVSDNGKACPHCGAPFPADKKRDGWGYEYKSKVRIFGLPLVHVSFKYGANQVPVPAVGVIAIGQFACGILTVSQFGVGVVSVSQITVAGYALAQIAFAHSMIAQVGIYIHEGHGQVVKSLSEMLAML